jgi:fibronectin-binding autotransporter adhesin
MANKSQITRRKVRVAAASVVAAMGLGVAITAVPAVAAVSTWQGASPGTTADPRTGNWNTAGNWSPSGVPSSSTATELDFNGSTATAYTATNNISGTFTLNILKLNSTASVQETIAGGTLDFEGATHEIQQAGSGAFLITSNIDNTPVNAQSTLTLSGSGTGLVTISGAITEKNSSKGINIQKTGASTFLLSAPNVYSDGTTIKAGTILIGVSDATTFSGALGLGSVLLGDTTGSSNAALYTNGAFSMGRPITIQSGNTGLVTLGGNTANASTFGGSVTFGTASGASKSATFVALAGGSTEFSGVLNENTSVANTGVTIGDASHTGTVKFSNAANAYAGPTTITNGATLEVTKMSNGGSNSSIGNSGSAAAAGSAATDLVFTGGAGLKYTGTGDSTNRLFTFDAGGVTIDASASANGALNFTGTGSLVASGTGDRTLTLTGSSTGANTLTSIIPNPSSGATSLTKGGGGTWVLGGANTYSGTTSVTNGTLTLNGSLVNSSTISVNNGATFNVNGAIPAATNLTANGTVNFTGVSPTVATLTDSGAGTRSVTIANGLTLTHTGTSAFGGSISGAGSLAKTTGGGLTLTGTSTYGGTTAVSAGTLTVNGAINGAGGAVTVSGTGKLQGTGTVARTINLNSGGTISPAGDGTNSNVGTLSTNAENWAGGSTYVWEIKDAAGPAGTGYDTLNVSGAVNVTATTGSKMTINLVSHGAIANFDGIQPWDWNIATGSSNVTGFTSTDQFTLVTTDFTDDNPNADPGAFKVSVSGSSVRVTYLPEPTSTVMGCVGAAAILRRRRRL